MPARDFVILSTRFAVLIVVIILTRMVPGKHQRSKQRRHDLGWKVHEGAQSFVFLLFFYWLVPQYGVNNYCVLCTVKAQKGNKNLQQRTFVGFHNHSPLLTMILAKTWNKEN